MAAMSCCCCNKTTSAVTASSGSCTIPAAARVTRRLARSEGRSKSGTASTIVSAITHKRSSMLRDARVERGVAVPVMAEVASAELAAEVAAAAATTAADDG